MSERYGIAEWYGRPFPGLSAPERHQFAVAALREGAAEQPPCPFQAEHPPCSKRGGVCSIQRYTEGDSGRIGMPQGHPVITCPVRFSERNTAVSWLAEIVGFPPADVMIAAEVPFMEGAETNKPAGKIDLIVASMADNHLTWYGLEIQAVYFSGPGMESEFTRLRDDTKPLPPFPSAIRRPDWRSSSAKRLMPQLQIKAPTVRRWGSKIAVAVDAPFFEAIGGASAAPSHDLNDGDIIWLVPYIESGDAQGCCVAIGKCSRWSNPAISSLPREQSRATDSSKRCATSCSRSSHDYRTNEQPSSFFVRLQPHYPCTSNDSLQPACFRPRAYSQQVE